MFMVSQSNVVLINILVLQCMQIDGRLIFVRGLHDFLYQMLKYTT